MAIRHIADTSSADKESLARSLTDSPNEKAVPQGGKKLAECGSVGVPLPLSIIAREPRNYNKQSRTEKTPTKVGNYEMLLYYM